MISRILLFGRLGSQFGREIEVDLPDEGCSVGELRALLGARLPDAVEDLRGSGVSVCLDQRIAAEGERAHPRQEIAILPPLSGG